MATEVRRAVRDGSRGTRGILAVLAVLVVLISATLSKDARAQQVVATADGAVVTTPTIELTLSRGAITRVVNRVTGEVHTDAVAERTWMPRGVLAGAGGAQNMQAIQLLHADWAQHPLYNGEIGASLARVDRMPGQQSVLETAPIDRGLRCTWRGLTDGTTHFPNDVLTVEVTADPSTGFVEIAASASSAAHDVVGVLVPVTNLKPKHNLYVPSFGGLIYLPTDFGTGRLCTFGMPPFIEAPVLVAEGTKGSLGLWIEDPTFRPYFGFIGGDGRTLAMGLEGLNLMPFESKRQSRTVRWKIGAFAGAWPNAMRPYRNWYAQAFASEIALRDAAAWTRDVSVIVDQTSASPDALTRLAALIDPSRVLIHEWNTRAAGFDKALPDHTPSPAFVSLVERARVLGFRSMGYVNASCVNSQSTSFGQQRIAEVGLTRKTGSIGSYLKAPKTFQNAGPDEILYLDPLAPAWRRLHVDAMIRWRAATGADANYADTAGLAGDFGNGVVDGLAGAEGGAAQARELLARNPVPMATEYGTDHVAFSANWTLRYAQVWGTPEVRKGWESRHRPITPYLFSGGTRAWVPTLRAESEQGKWTVLACSDALGGVAQLEAGPETFDATAGLARHMRERAVLFAERGLVPYHENWPLDPTLVCQYRDRDGAIYRYRIRGGVQELVDAKGTPLYQRVTGRPSVASPLQIAGWPAYGPTGPIALNPAATYALTAGAATPPSIVLDRVPNGSHVARFVDSADFALVALHGPSKPTGSPILGLVAREDFADVVVTDRKGNVVRRNSPLRKGERHQLSMAEPESVLLIKRPVAPAVVAETSVSPLGFPNGRFVIDPSGLERGGAYLPPHQRSVRLTGATAPTPMRFVSWGGDSEIAFDYLIQVPVGSTSAEVEFRNTQTRHGNGGVLRAYVNGRLVSTQDLGPTVGADGRPTWDVRAQRWRIPLGAHDGRTIVLTLAVWGKADDNSDEIWMSVPRLVRDASQQPVKQSIAIAAE